MEIRFYFDYSDYRSYLMMHTLKSLEPFPVWVRWIALDAYSLRALSHCEIRDHSENERNYLKRSAIRFCKRENLDFVWRNDRVFLGSALRVGSWLMQNNYAKFEEYSRKVLTQFWGYAQNLDQKDIAAILASLQVNSNEIFEDLAKQDSFQFQDICLQKALNLGVFDVPAIVIDREMICHYDQAQELKRLAINTWLHGLPQDNVYSVMTSILEDLPNDKCQQYLAELTRHSDIHQISTTPQEFVQIQHMLAVPEDTYPTPRKAFVAPIACTCFNSAPTLNDAINALKPDSINICLTRIKSDSKPVLSKNSIKAGLSSLLIAEIQIKQSLSLMAISTDSEAPSQIYLTTDETPLELLTFRDVKIALISPSFVLDLNVIRRASHLGAHIIIVPKPPQNLPAEALGPLSCTWVITMNPASVIDINAKKMSLSAQDEIQLSTDSILPKGSPWIVPASRTLLLCEQSLTFGNLSERADIELSCRGQNLLVATPKQSSELSRTRGFERLRLNDSQILILPIHETQLFLTELVSHRLLETINQAPRDSIPFLVNYWSSLEFEMLDVIRPVIAAIVAQFHLPVILVIGSQIIEIWHCSPQNAAYIIEKEGDGFTIDISDIPNTGTVFNTICDGLGLSAEAFIQHLQEISTI